MYHPVTTEIDLLPSKILEIEKVLDQISINLIIIYPNNDLGSDLLIKSIEKLKSNKKNLKSFPSINFESFLVLLKNSKVIIGNSSAGIKKPHYNLPTVNIGTRQNGRSFEDSIINSGETAFEILKNINF